MKPRFSFRTDKSKYGKRHVPGVMNQTEGEYATLLQARKQAGEVVEWWFESINLKISADNRYTADFAVLLSDGSMEFVDVKSPARIDPASLVKIKACAEKFFQFTFAIEQKRAKRDGGGFERREF